MHQTLIWRYWADPDTEKGIFRRLRRVRACNRTTGLPVRPPKRPGQANPRRGLRVSTQPTYRRYPAPSATPHHAIGHWRCATELWPSCQRALRQDGWAIELSACPGGNRRDPVCTRVPSLATFGTKRRNRSAQPSSDRRSGSSRVQPAPRRSVRRRALGPPCARRPIRSGLKAALVVGRLRSAAETRIVLSAFSGAQP